MVIMEYTDGTGGTVQNSTLDSTGTTVTSEKDQYNLNVYPNPFNDLVNLDFTNDAPGNRVSAEVYDLTGRIVYRKEFNNLAAGRNILVLNGIEQAKATTVCLVALKVNGQIVRTVKLLRNNRK